MPGGEEGGADPIPAGPWSRPFTALHSTKETCYIQVFCAVTDINRPGTNAFKIQMLIITVSRQSSGSLLDLA